MINKKFERWLTQAYRYYITFDNDMSDYEWDMDARELSARWDEITHPDKDVIRNDEMFSLYYLRQEDYPEWAKK